jgi:hypothetical protein
LFGTSKLLVADGTFARSGNYLSWRRLGTRGIERVGYFFFGHVRGKLMESLDDLELFEIVLTV